MYTKQILIAMVFLMCIMTVTSQEISLQNTNLKTYLLQKPNHTSKMKWYMLQGENKLEIGEVSTQHLTIGDSLIVITSVNLKQNATKWTDSTICNLYNFKPLYHSSYNHNRDITIAYNDTIKIKYENNINNKKNELSVIKPTPYIDSNFYPFLIKFLPYDKQEQFKLKIFEYNPDTEGPILKDLHIQKVQLDNTDQIAFNKPYWKVKVWLNNQTDQVSYYFIGKDDNEIWKQKMQTPRGEMLMELIHQ